MIAVKGEGVSENNREAYLRQLHEKASQKSAEGQTAFEELDSIASGRNDLPLAKELLRDLETKKQ